MFYDIDVAQSDNVNFGGGAQDNGTIVTSDGPADRYFEILGGDGGWMVYDPKDTTPRNGCRPCLPPRGWHALRGNIRSKHISHQNQMKPLGLERCAVQRPERRPNQLDRFARLSCGSEIFRGTG
jgi:hypothetical protein